MLTNKVKKVLSIKHVTLILTIGNTLRSDDGIGPYIAEGLEKLNIHNLKVVNAGERPEGLIDEVGKYNPEKTIIIDAACFNGKSGEIRVIPNEAMDDFTLSTHTFPVKVIAKMIEEDTECRVCFLGIQPEKVSLGEGLSEKVREAGDEIIAFYKNIKMH